MPSKKTYDLVSDDGYDSRIPLHNDEAFQHGLQFQAKYIGTLDVPRPSSRVEIVAAMRRIRYEFKAKAIKKKKVLLTVSVDGLKVNLRKKKKSQFSLEENRLLVMHHPIYRIFYVSHDSQDLKIWSYIARDGPSNVFKCNVFKAYKKSQAMKIVRTIGQAFEVCHKLGGHHSRPNSDLKEDLPSERNQEDNEPRVSKNNENEAAEKKELNTPTKSPEINKVNYQKPTPPSELSLKQTSHSSQTSASNLSPLLGSPVLFGDNLDSASSDSSRLPLTHHHQMQLIRQQLEQQQHQTQVAIAQVHLLKDQLSAETAARIEAQARAHQLLLHNKDLLDHVTLLVTRVQQLEMKVNGVTAHSSENFRIPTQVTSMPDATTPRPAPVYLPDLRPCSSYPDTTRRGTGLGLFANAKAAAALDADSPDSGHKEMSSESLTYSLNGGDATTWMNPYGPTLMTASLDEPDRTESRLDWFAHSARSSSSPPSSSPSKSSTLKAGSTSSIDHPAGHSCTSNLPLYASDSYPSPSSNLHQSRSRTSPLKKEASDKVKLISPLASPVSAKPQNSDSKNSLVLNNSQNFAGGSYSSAMPLSSSASFNGGAPKLDPPPRFRRSTRSIERWERGSWYGQSLAESTAASAFDGDYHPSYSSNGNKVNCGQVSVRPTSRTNNNINNSSIITSSSSSSSNCSNGSNNTHGFGCFSYNDSNATHLPAASYTNNHDNSSVSFVSCSKQKLDLRINDLSSGSQQRYPQGQRFVQQQQQQPNSKWRPRASYTSDDNSDVSTDHPNLPRRSQARDLDRLESLRG